MHAATLAEDSSNARGDEAFRRDDRLLEFICSHAAGHRPRMSRIGRHSDSTGAYMAFKEAPQPADHLLPGMYELNEEVVCRRRASGDIPWNWNVGIISPKMPPPTKQCKH